MQVCLARMQITSAPKLPRWEQSSSTLQGAVFMSTCLISRRGLHGNPFIDAFQQRQTLYFIPLHRSRLLLKCSGFLRNLSQSNTISETNSNLAHNTLRATQHHKHCHLPWLIYGLKIYFIPKALMQFNTPFSSHTRNNTPHHQTAHVFPFSIYVQLMYFHRHNYLLCLFCIIAIYAQQDRNRSHKWHFLWSCIQIWICICCNLMHMLLIHTYKLTHTSHIWT